MPNKPKIPANEILADIRDGMTSKQLREKYHLSQKGLWSAFSKLVSAKLVRNEELEIHFIASDGSVVRDGVRQWPRVTTHGSLLVHDMDDLAQIYRIQDLSITGAQVIGIETYIGERKNFLISLADPDGDASTFTFEAECKWVGTEKEGNAPAAGFKITSISEENFNELHKLLRSLGCSL